MEELVKISALNVYPIKSCAGIELKEAQLVRTGLNMDRCWLLIDQNGEVVTQRKKEAQKLALVIPRLIDTGVEISTSALAEELLLPHEYTANGELHEVSVWGSKCMGREESAEASAWFSRYLGFAVKLVRFEHSMERVVNPEVVGNDLSRATFQDGYPLHLIAEESLVGLNQLLIERGAPQVKMSRFRPNIVVSGMGKFGEDNALGLEGISNPIILKFPKRCSRCVMVNVEQTTGSTPELERTHHPLTVLSKERLFKERDGKMKPGFGQNAVVENIDALPTTIKVGDTFKIRNE